MKLGRNYRSNDHANTNAPAINYMHAMIYMQTRTVFKIIMIDKGND